MIEEAASLILARVIGVIMSKPTQGRVLELPKPTEPQRKAISRVVSSIKAVTGRDFETIYVTAIGSKEGYAYEDEKNLQKGKIAQWKASKIYRWIGEHYLPMGCDIAPEVFDPSLLTRWRDFMRQHGVYDRLSFHFPDELGLTGRSSKQPIAERPIPLGKPYLFDLNCRIAGQMLSLEATGGKTYPFSLHPDEVSVALDVEAGQLTLPLNANGIPDPLSETEDKGLRCYVFIIASLEIIATCADGLHSAHPIGLDKLDQIALAFKGVDADTFEVHRLNVIFK